MSHDCFLDRKVAAIEKSTVGTSGTEESDPAERLGGIIAHEIPYTRKTRIKHLGRERLTVIVVVRTPGTDRCIHAECSGPRSGDIGNHEGMDNGKTEQSARGDLSSRQRDAAEPLERFDECSQRIFREIASSEAGAVTEVEPKRPVSAKKPRASRFAMDAP